MQGIAIKNIINISLNTHHSQESRGRGGVFLPHSAISNCSRKSVNLFLGLQLS